MKLRRALAILAFFAVAILPVAAAPAVMTGDIYTGWITDGTNWNGYVDWNAYVKAQIDDFTNIYINFGRALQAYETVSAAGVTSHSQYEQVNNQYLYANTDLAKFFALDKSLVLILQEGYYYYGTAAYASKLVLAYPRIAYRYTTAPNWVLYAQVGLPAPMAAGIKFAVAPVAFTYVGQPFAFTNDWIVVPYANLNLGGGMTTNIDASYYQNKNATLGKGVITAEADFNYNVAPIKIEAGAGIDVDLSPAAGATTMYMVSARGTYYLDDKSTTYVQAAAGIRGTFTAVTSTTYPLDRVEINFQGTFIPQVDILECVSLDLTSTTAPFRSADTCVRMKAGLLQVNVGYLYGNNVGSVWGSANFTPASSGPGGAYIRIYAPF